MPKIKFKRLLSLILTLCMVATMLPAMTLPVFAANGKADTVVFPGNQHLDEDYPLLNKDGKKERSGPKKELDGINYIAHLDVSTGTLTLWNYEGGTIYSRLGEMVPGPKDMIVVLKGDNIINGSLSEETGGNITITTVGDERASLKIQYHRENNSVDQPLEGIWNNNDNSEITISGKADISIDVENTGTSGVNGIRASNGLTVGGDVNLDIKAKNTGVFASGTTTGIVTKLGDIVIDTTGDVSIDTSGAGEGGYSYSLITMDKNRAIKLDNAKTLVLKWTKDGKNGLAYNGNLIYDENDYYVNDEEVKRTLSIFKKQVGKNFVQVVKGSGTGLYWPGESVNIVADPGPADYICQWKVRSDSDVASVGFANENAASTSFIMPNG